MNATYSTMYEMIFTHVFGFYIVLLQEDMQKGVHGRFMDQSTSVREAAVELVGRFILNKPELTHQYYEMIMERILVSICIMFKEFHCHLRHQSR